jgi:adenylate cyclase
MRGPTYQKLALVKTGSLTSDAESCPAAYFMARRSDEAIASMRRSPILSPVQQAWLAASYALGGKVELARDCTDELLRPIPNFSGARFVAKHSLMRQEDVQHLSDGLRKAGLPK